MIIRNAEFFISSEKVSQCPAKGLPEYAFIGRSNVGKSSLINMLTGNGKLAKTSATPGKTMLINHFLINGRSDRDIEKRIQPGSWFLVDLPGYGYAKRSKKAQDNLEQMISSYILERMDMTLLFVLVDSRHEPQKIDLEFIQWLGENGVPFSIVFTKADKLSKGKLSGNVQKYISRLMEDWEEIPTYFITSSETRQGREELLDYIQEINRSLLEQSDTNE